MKSTVLSIILFCVCLITVSQVQAVPRPGAIKWAAPSMEFVTSLYVGVLGRNPENRRVVSGWARRVNRTPASRWRAFRGFINSREYRGSRWGKQRKLYAIFYRTPSAGRQCYTVARRYARVVIGGKIYSAVRGGPYNFGEAQAIMNYRRVFLTRGLGDACIGISESKKVSTTIRNRIRRIGWGSHAKGLRRRRGQRFTYVCPPNGKRWKIWGSTIFIDSSSICTAAVHDGRIGFRRGGRITIQVTNGRNRYTSYTKNGVTSIAWGRGRGSFFFVGNRKGATQEVRRTTRGNRGDVCKLDYNIFEQKEVCRCSKPGQTGLGTISNRSRCRK